MLIYTVSQDKIKFLKHGCKLLLDWLVEADNHKEEENW